MSTSIFSPVFITCAAGVFLIFVAILGGGLEVKEIRIPSLGTIPRFLCATLGTVLIGIPVTMPSIFETKPNQFRERAENVPPSSPLPSSVPEPVFMRFASNDLGVSFLFPNNILSLDTTEREKGRLYLRDGDGSVRVRVIRAPLQDQKDIRQARETARQLLLQQGYTVTYVAPEKEANWDNWYVLSGIVNNQVIYLKRWYLEDSIGSFEFIFPKGQDPLYQRVIPAMTFETRFSKTTPKSIP